MRSASRFPLAVLRGPLLTAEQVAERSSLLAGSTAGQALGVHHDGLPAGPRFSESVLHRFLGKGGR